MAGEFKIGEKPEGTYYIRYKTKVEADKMKNLAKQ